MKLRIVITLVALALAGTAEAASPDAAIIQPIVTFGDAFNRGDIKTAAATHNPAGVVIVDEDAPFLWRGRAAFADWMCDLDAKDQKAGISGEHVAMSPPTRIEHNDARAPM